MGDPGGEEAGWGQARLPSSQLRSTSRGALDLSGTRQGHLPQFPRADAFPPAGPARPLSSTRALGRGLPPWRPRKRPHHQQGDPRDGSQEADADGLEDGTGSTHPGVRTRLYTRAQAARAAVRLLMLRGAKRWPQLGRVVSPRAVAWRGKPPDTAGSGLAARSTAATGGAGGETTAGQGGRGGRGERGRRRKRERPTISSAADTTLTKQEPGIETTKLESYIVDSDGKVDTLLLYYLIDADRADRVYAAINSRGGLAFVSLTMTVGLITSTVAASSQDDEPSPALQTVWLLIITFIQRVLVLDIKIFRTLLRQFEVSLSPWS